MPVMPAISCTQRLEKFMTNPALVLLRQLFYVDRVQNPRGRCDWAPGHLGSRGRRATCCGPIVNHVGTKCKENLKSKQNTSEAGCVTMNLNLNITITFTVARSERKSGRESFSTVRCLRLSLPRTAARTHRRFESEFANHFLEPYFIAKRLSALDTGMQSFQYILRLHSIAVTEPLPEHVDRPSIEQSLATVMTTMPQAGPTPQFRPLEKARPQRIAFHVPAYDPQMFIFLHRKRFETALIKRASSRRVIMRMPTLRMRDPEPAQILGQIAIGTRPEHEMPTVRHEAYFFRRSFFVRNMTKICREACGPGGKVNVSISHYLLTLSPHHNLSLLLSRCA